MVKIGLWQLPPLYNIYYAKILESFHFLLALYNEFIKKGRYRKNFCSFFLKTLKTVDWHTTFTERSRNQEISHLEDDPYFLFYVFLFFCFFFVFFKWIKLFWATYPMIKETRKRFHEWSNCSRRPARWRIKRKKGFASGLIVPGDLPDRKNKTRKGFREWSNCSRRFARWRIKREKGFASGLIFPGDLPDRKSKTQKGFGEWSNCSRRPAR